MTTNTAFSSKLSIDELNNKLNFIDFYITSDNAASGSVFDPNANVSHKNIATLSSELFKDLYIDINRKLLYRSLCDNFNEQLAEEYIKMLKNHDLYTHDETSIFPYCCSVSLYPFLLHGMLQLGGESKPPKHIDSYCGSFINLVFALASQFAGAIATPEFLLLFDYFARKDYGDNYLETHTNKINASLQHVVYSLNQPAAARGFQSVFWNISIYDSFYFESIFGDFKFPETFESPNWESLKKLQEYFMTWFNKEREVSLLTFPVITAAVLYEKDTYKIKDEQFVRMCCKQLAEGNSFFIYESDSPDSLASCCRLRNEIVDKPAFSYTLGAGGVSTGSINVMTLNINRLVQLNKDINQELDKVHNFQIAYRKNIEKFLKEGILPAYDAGFINLNKQFLTIGISGIAEAAESQGIKVGNNEKYKEFVVNILKKIYDANRKKTEETGYLFNTEMVPGENLGVKFAKWDKSNGLKVNRDCYNSYFYIVEDEDIDIFDKFVLHGREIITYLDGGSALHLNLDTHLDEDGYYNLFEMAAITGCNYWTTNVKSTCCDEITCGHINKKTTDKCIKCGSDNISHATRVIGYLKKVKSFSADRQKEHSRRYYH